MKEFIDFSRTLALESGKIIKKYFLSDINVEVKADASPVTIADKKSEEIMRELIMKEYPEHGIFGEEFGSYKSGAEYVWMLDPIDGTKSFISGVPLFGTLIAVVRNNKPITGLINNPILQQMIYGDNKTSVINDNPARIADRGDLSKAILLTTDHKDVYKYQNGRNFEKLVESVKLYRTWGDCYGYYLLAAGYADIMIDPIMSKWDIMALIPVINGAGGAISDYYGNDPVKGTSIVASSKKLHSRIIEILNEA